MDRQKTDYANKKRNQTPRRPMKHWMDIVLEDMKTSYVNPECNKDWTNGEKMLC